jgi:hypothetical protein
MENDRLIVLLERTARMDEKLDALLNDSNRHEERISKVERHVNMGYGVVSVLTFMVATFAQFFWSKIFGKNG